MVAWQSMEVEKRYAALAFGADEMHRRVERGKCHAHVRWMRRDAMLRRAENSMVGIETVDGVAAGAGFALVTARSGSVVEISAARPLQDIAPDGRHVTNLRRGAREQGTRQHRITCPHGRMRGDDAVTDGRADQ